MTQDPWRKQLGKFKQVRQGGINKEAVHKGVGRIKGKQG